MNGFRYVYILQSASGGHFYTGLTDDLRTRLLKQNAGGVLHPANHRPWVLKSAVAYRSRGRAAVFENYLKSSSGRAFAKKRL